MSRAHASALAGLALALPMGLLFLAAWIGLGPLGEWLRSVLTVDGIQPSPVGHVYMLGGLVLLIPAFAIAAWPIVRRREVPVANVAALVVIGGLIIATWGGLADEVVRCEVLGIPNCD